MVHAIDDVAVTERTLKLLSVTKDSVTTPLNQSIALNAAGQGRLDILDSHMGTLLFEATAKDSAVTRVIGDPDTAAQIAAGTGDDLTTGSSCQKMRTIDSAFILLGQNVSRARNFARTSWADGRNTIVFAEIGCFGAAATHD